MIFYFSLSLFFLCGFLSLWFNLWLTLELQEAYIFLTTEDLKPQRKKREENKKNNSLCFL